MDEITRLASELGKLIARQDAYTRLREAEIEVQGKPEVRQVLEQFEQQRRKIASLEAANRPIEVEDKHRMQRLAEAVHTNPLLQNLLRAQADYIEIMNRVNAAIRKELDAAFGASDEGQEQP